MITAFLGPAKMVEIKDDNLSLLKDALWIDLFSPTDQEKLWIKQWINIEIPTKEDMREIELSSRLYRENDSLIMTAMMLANSGSFMPQYEPITFMITQNQMLTLRYIEPQSFKLFISRVEKNSKTPDAPNLFVALLDAAADRLADILELIGRRLAEYSMVIFQNPENSEKKSDYNTLLLQLGTTGSLNSKARESLETFARLISFFKQEMGIPEGTQLSDDIKMINDDIKSLNNHVNFLSSEINFLLNATLGLISIEQNNIIKIFSIMAVIFLPPTLIATIYGMNFRNMPELHWALGYPMALALIILTAWIPYKYFKIRKWM